MDELQLQELQKSNQQRQDGVPYNPNAADGLKRRRKAEGDLWRK